jgi:putative nucleotidyltransferase with HDIG domain
MQEIDDFIAKAQHLPPAPQVLPRLMQALASPNVPLSDVIQLINVDPGLTASVLQRCNSAYFRGAMPAETVFEAVTRLGFNQIFRMVTSLSGTQIFKGAHQSYGLKEDELWKHSLTAAAAAQVIAQDLGDDENVAFTAALLHDVGKIVLAQVLEHIYERLVQEIEARPSDAADTEKQLLGVHHGEVGGRLLAQWKFPPQLVAAVWSHHSPEAAGPHQRLASIVHVANLTAYFLGCGYGYQAFALRGSPAALEVLNLTPDHLPAYVLRTKDLTESIYALLRLNN